jgi:hypothetical protein
MSDPEPKFLVLLRDLKPTLNWGKGTVDCNEIGGGSVRWQMLGSGLGLFVF